MIVEMPSAFAFQMDRYVDIGFGGIIIQIIMLHKNRGKKTFSDVTEFCYPILMLVTYKSDLFLHRGAVFNLELGLSTL